MPAKIIFGLKTLARPGRREGWALAALGVCIACYLPFVLHKILVLGQGDIQVFFRAGWAVWTGYPLYQVTDHHGFSFQYLPTFALLMAPFANSLPSYPQPAWALPYGSAIVIWYLLNTACLLLAIHAWANALERLHPLPSGGWMQSSWLLRLGTLMALLPFVGDGLGSGQVTSIVLLLIVSFLYLYAEKRVGWASFLLALAVAIKIYPIVFALFPLLRRDDQFAFQFTCWCVFLLIGVPVICLGPNETISLYHALWLQRLAGIISGDLRARMAYELSFGSFKSISIGAVVARIEAGSSLRVLPNWATVTQYAFDFFFLMALVVFGHDRFWSLRRIQPTNYWPFFISGALLLSALPLLLPTARPHYLALAMPLVSVLIVDRWWRAGRQITRFLIVAWAVLAWIAMLTVESSFDAIKIFGPDTIVLLLLLPPGFALLAKQNGKGALDASAKVAACSVQSKPLHV